MAPAGGVGRFRRSPPRNPVKPHARPPARGLHKRPRMKPTVLTHNFQDGTFTATEPIIITWNGVDMPKVLRAVKPGQYVLLPFEPADDILRPPKEAA